MRPYVIIDELHSTLFVLRSMNPTEIQLIRRTLQRGVFRKRLEEATRSVIDHFPSLKNLRFTISS